MFVDEALQPYSDQWTFAEPHAMDAERDEASYRTSSVYVFTHGDHSFSLTIDPPIRDIEGGEGSATEIFSRTY